MNCGFKLDSDDNFCPNCGVRIVVQEVNVFDKELYNKYSDELTKLKDEYNIKIEKASELLKKQFDSSERTYAKFVSTINDSNNLFYNQIETTFSMLELARRNSSRIEKEIENKIETLKFISGKMDDLIDELIIHISNNKRSDEDLRNLTAEMDDLINSVKDY